MLEAWPKFFERKGETGGFTQSDVETSCRKLPGIQRLRICSPQAGARVGSLVRELDPTHCSRGPRGQLRPASQLTNVFKRLNCKTAVRQMDQQPAGQSRIQKWTWRRVACLFLTSGLVHRGRNILSKHGAKGLPDAAVGKSRPASGGHRLDPWLWKVPHAAEQLSPCSTATELVLQSPRLQLRKPADLDRPALHT